LVVSCDQFGPFQRNGASVEDIVGWQRSGSRATWDIECATAIGPIDSIEAVPVEVNETRRSGDRFHPLRVHRPLLQVGLCAVPNAPDGVRHASRVLGDDTVCVHKLGVNVTKNGTPRSESEKETGRAGKWLDVAAELSWY
jgi:hypothetical protein